MCLKPQVHFFFFLFLFSSFLDYTNNYLQTVDTYGHHHHCSTRKRRSSRGSRWHISSLWYDFFSLYYLFFFFFYTQHILLNHRNVYCIYVGKHVMSRSKKEKNHPNMEGICYLNLFHLVSGALESLLKPNHSLQCLYLLKFVLVYYSIWWSEALLWKPPFFFSQPAAGLTNQALVWDSWAGTPLSSCSAASASSS